MKRLFNITSTDKQESTDQIFLCEISNYHICLASADETTKQLIRLAYFENQQPVSSQDIKQVLEQEGIHLNRYKKVVVSSAFPETVLVPQAIFDINNLQNLISQTDQNRVFYDQVQEQGITVAYTFPEKLYHSLSSMAKVEMINVHTPALKMETDSTRESWLSVYFTGKEFRVLVKHAHYLQLAQVYAYTTPLDVVYYLLMICSQFGLSQSETAIVLAGLIDEDSAMYKEIHQYFTNIHFIKPGVYTISGNEHQHHFFSSIYNLAACVS